MLLFNRSLLLQGPGPEIMAVTGDLRAYVSEKIGREVALWSAMTGLPFGTMSFTTRVDGLAGAAEMNAAFAADAGYHDRVAKLREFIASPPETSMMQAIHGEIGEASPPVGSVATVTSAVAAAGYDACVAWGVEVAQVAESVMGQGVLFGSALAGTFGQFTWISVSPDAASADAANEKLMASPEYLGKINDATSLWVPGAANRAIAIRVA